jgi:hypothetical protein
VLPNTLTLKLYVVKEEVRNHIKSMEHKSNKQVLADPLTKGLPPSVFREHIVDMGLWYSLCFPDNKGPKVKESVLTVTMKHFLYTNL